MHDMRQIPPLKDDSWVLLVVCVLASIGVILLVSNGYSYIAKKTPQDCITEMFSDADRFDPSGHFEIRSDEAPPFPEAIKWINENLERCMG